MRTLSGGALTDQSAGVAAALVGISAEAMVRHLGDVGTSSIPSR